MNTFFIVFGFVALFFILMATRILLKKDGEFRGTCATNNPMLEDKVGKCTVCGKEPSVDCENA